MSTTPTRYEVVVDGHLDDHWSDWLGGWSLTRNPDGTSTLTGRVTDQSQLQASLARLGDISATLLTVKATSADNRDPHRARTPGLVRSLSTERLLLRPATEDDVEATWAFRRLDEVNEWLTGRADHLDAYRELFTAPERLATTVVMELRHDAATTVIGDLMLRRGHAWAQVEVAAQAQDAEAELGWVVAPAHAGHGYATEAVRELIRHCFTDLGVRPVVANCFLDNIASWRLMERVGMRRESHAVRDSLHRSGRWLDTVVYALLADEQTVPSGASDR